MVKRTRVVGIAGRYGARYGSTLRKKVRDILQKRYSPHTCPFCGYKGKVVRLSTGIWMCRKCGVKWAGGAYVPRTELSKYFDKVVVRE
ncbi:MAG: 50S ribosomal protein L37ae [Desulfurococcales archaeon ex4484_58]|nr:MAG: 50S ribosomal protein L37ae [Desulfurococcales archaeon ex4484_58]